jgi:hypothetical protein
MPRVIQQGPEPQTALPNSRREYAATRSQEVRGSVCWLCHRLQQRAFESLHPGGGSRRPTIGAGRACMHAWCDLTGSRRGSMRRPAVLLPASLRSGSHDAVHAYSNAKRTSRCHCPGMPDEHRGWATHALVPRPRMRSSSTLVIDVHTCTIASAQTPAQSGRIRQAGSGRLVPMIPSPCHPLCRAGRPTQ